MRNMCTKTLGNSKSRGLETMYLTVHLPRSKLLALAGALIGSFDGDPVEALNTPCAPVDFTSDVSTLACMSANAVPCWSVPLID